MVQRKRKKPRTQKQQARDAEQKEKMRSAAAHLFSAKGFKKVTLDEIAGDVQLTKQCLYDHFPDKREILKECIERALLMWRTSIDAQKSQLRPSAEAVKSIVEEYADVAFSDFGMCLMNNDIENLYEKHRRDLLRQKADIDVRFTELIAQVIPRRFQSDSSPDFQWLIASSLVRGIALLTCLQADKRKILSKTLGLMT